MRHRRKIMEEEQIELEKTKKDINELREKMNTIILALEKVKMMFDPAQPNNIVSESVEVSPSLHLPMKGFIPPPHTSYSPWYHAPTTQFPYQAPTTQFPYQFLKGESVSMNNQAEFPHPKEGPSRVTITVPNLDNHEIKRDSTGGECKIPNRTNIFGNIDTINELREKMNTIILALENVKMMFDPAQPNNTVSESVEVSPSLHLPMKGFIPPPHTSYSQWYHAPTTQFPYQFLKGESVSMKNQAEFLHLKEGPSRVTIKRDSTGGECKIPNRTNIFGNIDASKLCLVPDVVISPKFRVPEFEKYDGTSCPKSHFTMYCRKMDLQRMEKNSTESFKEYTQRWIDVVSQVQPPLTDKELMDMFMNTLKSPFYDLMIGSTTTNFSDIITIGERIEYGIKYGKIIDTSKLSTVKKESFSKEAEGEVQMVANRNHVNLRPQPYSNAGIGIPQYSSNPHPQINQGFQPRIQQTSLHTQCQPNNREAYKQAQFDPIPITYTKLLPQLFQNNQLIPVSLNPLQPPYPKWYDVNARCNYHAGAAGHSTENCTALKYKDG